MRLGIYYCPLLLKNLFWRWFQRADLKINKWQRADANSPNHTNDKLRKTSISGVQNGTRKRFVYFIPYLIRLLCWSHSTCIHKFNEAELSYICIVFIYLDIRVYLCKSSEGWIFNWLIHSWFGCRFCRKKINQSVKIIKNGCCSIWWAKRLKLLVHERL